MPVAVEATGLLKSNLKYNPKKVPESPTVEETQLQATKGTITIVKRALSHTEL